MSAAAAQPLNSLESTVPATQVVPRVITLANIKKACKAHKEYSAADRARKKKEEAKKAAAMAVFEALLGVKSEDEVRAMSPGEFKRVARRRIRAGLVELRGVDVDVLLDQVIQKSKSERRPSWKDCFVDVLGESAATQITNATPESFSYKFVGAAL
jgi:hypothetical protein